MDRVQHNPGGLLRQLEPAYDLTNGDRGPQAFNATQDSEASWWRARHCQLQTKPAQVPQRSGGVALQQADTTRWQQSRRIHIMIVCLCHTYICIRARAHMHTHFSMIRWFTARMSFTKYFNKNQEQCLTWFPIVFFVNYFSCQLLSEVCVACWRQEQQERASKRDMYILETVWHTLAMAPMRRKRASRSM